MIKKKTTARKATAPKRRRRSAAVSKAAPRRRRSVAKKGMLSEMFNAASATAGAKSAISGAVGGAAAGLVGKFLGGTTEADNKKSAIYQIAGGFLVATVVKLPNVGAGMAGVGMYNLMQASGFLADEVEYSDVDLEALPMVLNDDYLQDDYLQDDTAAMNSGWSYANY